MRKKIFIMLVAMAFSIVSVFSEARNALLIANGNYSHFSNLSTPVKEARELKNSLTQLGFSVTIVENASREKILDSLSDFEKILKSKGGIAFFHYGGHAVQVNGKNYLIPVNADIPDERRVATRAVDVDELMISMVADTNIVILDSCRNNPLPAANTREGTRGLVMATERPRNSIIVYSAQAGKTAQDGIFTPTLTKKILEKKSFTDILMDVRREVRSVTKNEQSPCEYNELEMPVFLAGNAGGGQNYVPQTQQPVDSKTAEEYYNLGVEAYERKDYGLAVTYYQKSILINENHKKALNNLGVCYENGFGVTQNYAKAEELYRKSANLGHVTAQNNLGDLYYFGKGVSQDFSEAKKWYLKAAEQGNAYGQYNVGWLFEHGHGVSQGIETALSYYQMAANQGHEDAKKRIAAINASNNTNASVQNNGKWLFPLYGIELGKTPVSELKKKGKKADKYDYYKINGQNFWYENNVFVQMHIVPGIYSWPTEWTVAGYDKNLSYNQWIQFLKSQGYEIFVTKKPTSEYWNEKNSLNAEVVAKRTYPVSHKIELCFNYSGKTSLSASGTMYSFTVDTRYLSLYTREKYPDDGSGSSSSSSSYSTTSSSQWLFPVYGLELGKSTEADVKRKSESVFTQNKYGVEYYVGGHDFDCKDIYGKRGMLNSVLFFNHFRTPWPQEIINKGYNPNYSYNQWKSFLISQGYTITKYSKSDKLDAEKSTPIKHNLAVYFKNDKTDSLSIHKE